MQPRISRRRLANEADSQEGRIVLGTRGARTWRVQWVVAGVRLTFKDQGDRSWTNAGVFRNVELAERQARLG